MMCPRQNAIAWPRHKSAMPSHLATTLLGWRSIISTAARVVCRHRFRFCLIWQGRLALQYSLANPAIHTTIVGTASPQRVLENIACAEEPLDEALLAEVLRILEPIHNVTWPSGRSENN